jgi:agmatine/peptidylarginine deiminase
MSAMRAYEQGKIKDYQHVAASIEKISMYDKLIQSFPNVKFIIYSSNNPLTINSKNLNFKMDKSEYDYVKERYANYNNVITIKSLNNEYATSWVRDWGPFSISKNKIANLQQKDNSKRVEYIANEAIRCKQDPSSDLPNINLELENITSAILDEELYLEGGNFMINSDGVCMSADFDPSNIKSLTKIGCKSVVLFNPLPSEETRHIDIFAKFLANNKVLISKYESNMVRVKDEANYTYFYCNEEQIQAEDWENCEFTRSAPGQGLKIKNIQSNQVYTSQKELFQNYSINNFYQNDWVKHSEDTKDKLEKLGFKVIEIKAPQPVASFEVYEYLNSKGEVVHTGKEVSYTFPTYTNSLITNNSVSIPQYSKLASKELNESAIKTYRKYFEKVIPINTDQNILQGGSIHCLTMDMHMSK